MRGIGGGENMMKIRCMKKRCFKKTEKHSHSQREEWSHSKTGQQMLHLLLELIMDPSGLRCSQEGQPAPALPQNAKAFPCSFPGWCSTVLASPTSWGIHLDLGFTFPSPYNGFSEHLWLKSNLSHTVWPQQPFGTLVQTSTTPSLLHPSFLQRYYYHMNDATGFWCQLDMEPGPFGPELLWPLRTDPEKDFLGCLFLSMELLQ